MADTKRKDVLREWAEGLSREAFVQGYEVGWTAGADAVVKRGQSARMPRSKVIRESDYESAPIYRNEMDGAPELAEEVRELRAVLSECAKQLAAMGADAHASRARALLPATEAE